MGDVNRRRLTRSSDFASEALTVGCRQLFKELEGYSVHRMRVGNEVKVVCQSSPSWNARGVITEIIQRRDEQKGKTLQECAVTFKAGRGWFMAEHLIRVRPSNTDHLLRGEACSRWPIQPDRVESIGVSRDTLIPFLCAYFGFSRSKATTEVDDFLNMFEERLRRARESEYSIQNLKAS